MDKMLNVTEGRGCYLGNCAAELGVRDKLAAARVQRGLERLQKLFERVLRNPSDDTCSDAERANSAALLVAQVQGLLILRKAGMPAERIRRLSAQALSALAR